MRYGFLNMLRRNASLVVLIRKSPIAHYVLTRNTVIHPIRFGLDFFGRTQIHSAITYTNSATYATANTQSGSRR